MSRQPPKENITLIGASHYHQDVGRHPRGQEIPRSFELVELLTGGRGWVHHEGEWRELTAGSLVWQMPGDWTIQRSDFTDPYHCLSVKFRTGRSRGRRVPRITRWSDLAAVRAFTDELVELWIRGGVPNELLTTYAFSRLRLQALVGEQRSEQTRLPEALQRSQELIRDRFHERLPVSDLARTAGCSEPHLHDLYRRHLNSSPHQVILEVRLQQACRLLSSTAQPIKRIAAEVGFSTPAAFSHAFRKYARVTPAAYRIRSRRVG